MKALSVKVILSHPAAYDSFCPVFALCVRQQVGPLKITDFEAEDESSPKKASFERHKRPFVSTH